MRANKFFLGAIALIAQVAYGQKADSNVKDSLKVTGDMKVEGYIITKHIKSPDGTIHLGDSSMTLTTYTAVSNPIKGGTYTMEGQSTSGSTSAIGIGWSSYAAAASRAMALGYNAKAYGDNSMAIGHLAEVDADQSTAIGYNTKVGSSGTYAIAIGSGYSGNPMLNNTSQSLAVGFNSTVPTLFVSGGNGTSGSLGYVGVGTTSPAALLDVSNGGSMRILGNSSGDIHSTTNIRPHFSSGGDFTVYEGSPGSSTLRFKIAGTSGNVGINTSSPSYTLDVSGNARVTGALTSGATTVSSFTNSGNTTLSGTLGSGATTVTSFTNSGNSTFSGTMKNTTYTVGASGKRVLEVDETGLFSALAAGTASQVLYGNGAWGSLPAQTFTLSGSNAYFTGGKVGIGNSSPSYSLDVTGDIRATGTITGGATSVTSFTNSGNTTLSGTLNSGATSVTSFTNSGNTTLTGTLNSGAATVSSLTTSGAISAATLTLSGSQTISGGLTSATVTAGTLLSSPKIVSTRIIAPDTNGVHIGDSSVVIQTIPYVGTLPSYDLISSSLTRLAISSNPVSGFNSKAYGNNSLSMGTGNSVTNASVSIALGNNVQTSTAAAGSIVMGRGVSGNPLINSTANSMYVGFNSNLPTFYVGASSGAGTTGKVGIGTTTPDSKLSVVGASGESGLTVKTTYPVDTYGYNLYIDVNRDETAAIAVVNEGSGESGNHFPTENFIVWGTGATRIGHLKAQNTPYSNALLMVGGTIATKEVYVVDGLANWSDYVFAKDYKLKPLSEVEQYVKENKHLPNVPSAAELQKNGLNVGQMQAMQMEKIEELTLYMIEMQKQIKALQEENKQLKENRKN